MGHLRLLKADPDVAHAVQQTGFLRAKRGYGLPKAALSADEMMVKKSSPWVSLREALDDGLELQSPDEEFDSHVVHDEGFFNRMQYSANHRYHYYTKISNNRTYIFTNIPKIRSHSIDMLSIQIDTES